jgi:F0F1-type ATP synthase assembly protein I
MLRNQGKKQLNNYARYSGLAFQMAAIILIGVFGGLKLDRWTGWKFPLFTVVFSLLSVFAAIYVAVKDFIKKK